MNEKKNSDNIEGYMDAEILADIVYKEISRSLKNYVNMIIEDKEVSE